MAENNKVAEATREHRVAPSSTEALGPPTPRALGSGMSSLGAAGRARS